MSAGVGTFTRSLLITAAADGQLTYDSDARRCYRWNGRDCDFDTWGCIAALVGEGLLEVADDTAERSPIKVTGAGWESIQ